MTPETRFELGARAEADVGILLSHYALTPGYELAAVLGPYPAARAEVAARLSEAGPLVRVSPSRAVVRDLEAALATRPEGRPIAWIHADAYDPDAWRGALAGLNQHRERVKRLVDGLVVLSGERDLLQLLLDYPDIGSTLGPTVRVDEAPRQVTPGVVRWLHLSDLHFRATETWESRAVLASLLRYLRDELVPGGLGPDLVLVTGDVAHSGQPAEYDRAETFFVALMDALGLKARERLFIVPGNHDVDRDRIGVMDKYLIPALLKGEDPAAVEEALTDQATMTAVGERLEAFYAFTRRLLGAGRGWTAETPWRADRVEPGGVPVGLVQLNTAWASGPGDGKGRLLVGAAQAREALHVVADTRIRLALMHHPPSWLAEFDERAVSGLLASRDGADALLHGHVHDVDTALRTGPDGATLVLGADATYTGGAWRKGFMLGELDTRVGEGRLRYFGYEDRGRGWWEPKNRYEGTKDGVWAFELPPHLRDAAKPGEAAPPAAPARGAPDAEAQFEALVARYRAAAASVHGAMSFIGLPDRTRRPHSATVADLFAPLQLATAQGHAGLDSDKVASNLVYREAHGRARRLVVLGGPGSGKTTLTRYLAVWAAGGLEIRDVQRPEGLVPLLVPFREVAADKDRGRAGGLLDFLSRQASEVLQNPRAPGFFERLLREGRALLLLDGLDEVPRPEQRVRERDTILALAGTYPDTPMLVTSRIVGYDDAPLPADRGQAVGADDPDAYARVFIPLTLQPLSDAAQQELVRRWYRVQEALDARARQQATADLLAALAAEPRARELARNPLLATLVCLVHRQRATLPGERVKLYELVVDTLLETWHEAKFSGQGFAEIDGGRQRRYLERLALEMQRGRADEPTAPKADDKESEVVIGREALLSKLTGIARKRPTEEDEATTGHRMGRWVDWLAARTGLLVEQRPAVFGFLHKTLLEYLAACALSEELGAKGAEEMASELGRLASQPLWTETLRLVLGLRADDEAFLAELLRQWCTGGDGCHKRLLLDGLREEIDVDDGARARILHGALESLHREGPAETREAVESLRQVARFSTRHAEGARRQLAELLDGWEDTRRLPEALLRALPDVLPDAAATLRAVDHLRARTRDGDQLDALWEVVETAAAADPEQQAAAAELRARFFDHIPPPPAGLFERVDTPHSGEVDLWCDVPAGEFWMGSPDGDKQAFDREWPRHRVRLTAGFRMAAVPVTAEQYAAFDDAWARRAEDDDARLHPVTDVSWHAATSFCRWLAACVPGMEGARLPTEAEWEKACRAGTDTRYWRGDDGAHLAEVGWYSGNSERRTHRVGELPPNGHGLFDMHGNVWEWTADWFAAYEARDEPIVDPTGPSDGDGRVARGGSSWDTARRCRSACRSASHPVLQSGVRGLRIVLPKS